MLKKVDDDVWKKINEEQQNKIKKHLETTYGNQTYNSYYYSSADGSDISGSDFGIIDDEPNFAKIT